MPKVQVNDIDMHYEVHGEGPPLLMLHGFSGASQAWTPLIKDYSERFQLIVPDLRGHGKTTNPSKKLSNRQASEDINELLKILGLKNVKAVGCSFGGDTLLQIATRYPNKIESMVLDGATPYYTNQMRKKVINLTVTEEQMKIFRQVHVFGDEQIELLFQNHVEMVSMYDDQNFTAPFLSSIQAKTLVILGDRDIFIPVEMATSLFEAIPDSYLWIVPNAGHALTMNSVDVVRNQILDFLTGKWE